MFSKWWGVRDLHLNDEFWVDVLSLYQDKNIPLPLEYNPHSARRVLNMLNCPPGKCGQCCYYEELPVDAADVNLISNREVELDDLAKLVKAKPDGSLYINCSGGCPFLKDNKCTIYDIRPSTCYFFPLNTPRMAVVNGRQIQQAMIRIKCPSSVDIVRTLMCEALASGGILLPDLSLVPAQDTE